MNNDLRPKVGVGLLLIRGNTILLGKRKSIHGDGEFGSVGGHLEHLESFEDGVLRELREEAGSEIHIKNLRFLCVSNVKRYAPKHYIDIGMAAEWVSGEPSVMEPEKLDFFDWYDLENLPKPLFEMIPYYIEAYKTGKVFF